MNLKDFEEIEEVKLYFVPNERYKVLGQLRSNSRIILVQCKVCEKDPELYGEGIFKVYKSNLYKGNSPCGCGSGFKYSESQTTVILSRLAKEREVKARLKTCVISKEEMPDGYTETTHLKNIDFIRDIYEEFSGNRKI